MSYIGGSIPGNPKTTLNSIRREPCHQVEPEGFVYKVLSVDQLVVLQEDIIDEVTNVLNLSPQIIRTLLNQFQWKKEQLCENYFESSPQEFFQRAHVLNPFEQKNQSSLESYNRSNDKDCEICYCSDKELYDLGCGHNYCVFCWKQYLANKTCSEGLTHTITCPAAECDILVDYASFLTLADDPEVVERYKQLIINTFVECNTLMRWCPAPNCTHAIEANYTEPKAVECKCGHQFCFGCGENWHEPVDCSRLKHWVNISIEDSETSIWIYRNTKRCPQCQVAIEKRGGCNHMVCQNRSCFYQFCWLCLRNWKMHTSCNVNNSSPDTSRETIARYQQSKDRYMKCMQSLMKDQKFYAKVDELKKGTSRIQIQFLRDAVKALCQCRSTLMYSYVFAFYLNNNNAMSIFQYNQMDLERATDKISEFFEGEITANNLSKIRTRVIELTEYCQQRRHVLLSHVQEGNEKEWWNFINETTLKVL